jgi:hypothetical protein
VTISGGIFEVQSGASTGSGAVTFAGSGGLLVLDSSASFGGLVAGFAATDQLDLKDIAFGSGTTVSFTEAASNLSGTLTVTDGAHTAQIALLGQYTAGEFSANSDGKGGTVITASGPSPAETTSATLAPPHA